MSARDVLRDFFRSRWAFLPINLMCLLGWRFYNFESSKPNGSASPFRKKNRKTFSYLGALVRAIHFTITMAGPHACRNSYQNPPPANEDELASAALGALTNDSGTFSYTFVVSYILTLILALLLAPAEFVAKYTDADLQRTTKLALELFV